MRTKILKNQNVSWVSRIKLLYNTFEDMALSPCYRIKGQNHLHMMFPCCNRHNQIDSFEYISQRLNQFYLYHSRIREVIFDQRKLASA